MKPQGYRQIVDALSSVEGATVTPVPAEGEDKRYLTVRTPEDIPPEQVLNALGDAGLMNVQRPPGYERDLVGIDQPSLTNLGAVPGSVTLEDGNTGNDFRSGFSEW